MINWETLKLTTTTLPMKIQYIWLIPFMLLIFVLTYLMVAITIDEVAEEGIITQDSKEKHEKSLPIILGIIAAILIYTIATSIYKDAYYKITVELDNPTLQMGNLSETPTLKQLNSYFYSETIKATNQPTCDTCYFRKANTKLYKESDKIYFTTVIWKDFYGRYKTPEQFKNELSGLIEYTVTWANRYIKEITVDKAAMQKFTEEHATDTKTMPKFEDNQETEKRKTNDTMGNIKTDTNTRKCQ